jgi:hypothetical protein
VRRDTSPWRRGIDRAPGPVGPARCPGLFKGDYPRLVDRYIDYFGGDPWGAPERDPCGEALLERMMGRGEPKGSLGSCGPRPTSRRTPRRIDDPFMVRRLRLVGHPASAGLEAAARSAAAGAVQPAETELTPMASLHGKQSPVGARDAVRRG